MLREQWMCTSNRTQIDAVNVCPYTLLLYVTFIFSVIIDQTLIKSHTCKVYQPVFEFQNRC